LDEQGNEVRVLKETTIGRILFNQVVPKEVGYINEILTKRSLRDIIAVVMKKAGADKVAAFLDDIKNMGYRMAFRGRSVVQPRCRDHPRREGEARAGGLRTFGLHHGGLQHGSYHQQRALQPDHRRLDEYQYQADEGRDRNADQGQ